MTDLSILIPARNEEFLKETVEDILKNIELDTEIIVVLDGQWPLKPLEVNPRVTIIYLPEARGQRAAQNIAAKLAKGKYLMKLDAHCAVDKGFDRILLADMEPDIVMVPLMRNLHVFDWVCSKCGERYYQGPTAPCEKCLSPRVKDIVWIAKTNPQSTSYCFDSEPHFQYHNKYKKIQDESGSHLVETMSLQGSCFLCTKEKYWEWNLCDESWGSWGSQGIEVATKAWFAGGRVLCNKATWYAHMFRTQGGDFSFPYPQSGKGVQDAKSKAREWIHSHPEKLKALVSKFNPMGWKNKPRKAVLYYTDSALDKNIASLCRDRILKGIKPKHITSVSLEPIQFGKRNITLDRTRGIETMFRQILAGLEVIEDPIVFFCEHDVLYDPSHFDFIPPREDKFYYNTNVWKLKYGTDLVVWTDDLQQTSGLVCYRELAIDWYRKKLRSGETKHFEPSPRENYTSKKPNIDIRHCANLTKDKWSPEEFKDPKYSKGWKESTLQEITK